MALAVVIIKIVVRVDHLAQRIVVFAGVTIAGQRKRGARTDDALAVADAPGLPDFFAAIVKFGVRPDAVQGNGPQHLHILPDAEGDGLVFIAGNLAAAVQGDAPRQAVQQGRLAEVVQRVVVIIAIFTHGHAVFCPSGTLQNRQRRVGHDKVLFAAVGFFYRHVIVAVAAGGKHIVDFKFARRNGGLIGDIAVLPHDNLRV